jgi:L-fucose isomerase-like protein
MKGGNLSFVESLLSHGIPHHNAIVYGDYLEEMREFARLLKIPCVIKE